MRIEWVLLLAAGCCGCPLPACAQETQASPPARQLMAPYVNFIEDADHPAYGLLYAFDVTPGNRLFLSGEGYAFDETRYVESSSFAEVARETGDSYEVELGYLRRVSPAGWPVRVSAGPSVAAQFTHAEIRTTQVEDGETSLGRAEAHHDPQVNVYANANVEYRPVRNISLFVLASWGYAFEHDYEVRYSTGTRPEHRYEADDDTFWNLHCGVGLAF